jgi:hypothetical protein
MILAKERPSYPHVSGWSISGGSGTPDDELRRQIRARLSEARLPAVDGVSNPHPGTGRPCIVCRRAIEPTEVERQLDGVGIVLIAHEACYMLWREESVLFHRRDRSEENSGPSIRQRVKAKKKAKS